MRTIREFIEACRASEEEYCEQHPHPVFLHAVSEPDLKPVQDSTKQTFERIAHDWTTPAGPGARPPNRELDADRAEHLYTIYVIRRQGGSAPVITVGCAFDCDVQIDDESVSMRHAYVTDGGGDCLLRDNHSTTGTQVNQEMFNPGEERRLRSGDKVKLGYVELTYLTAGGFHRFVRQLFID